MDKVAVLIVIGLTGACATAGIAWFACWLVSASLLMAALSAQCAGLLGASVSVGIWTLFRINRSSDMY